MMPGENGFDFARAIRAGSAVPILMLTARDEKESRIKGLEIGADDYLAKPFEPRELSLRDCQHPAPRAAAERAAGGIGAASVRSYFIWHAENCAAARRRSA